MLHGQADTFAPLGKAGDDLALLLKQLRVIGSGFDVDGLRRHEAMTYGAAAGADAQHGGR